VVCTRNGWQGTFSAVEIQKKTQNVTLPERIESAIDECAFVHLEVCCYIGWGTALHVAAVHEGIGANANRAEQISRHSAGPIRELK